MTEFLGKLIFFCNLKDNARATSVAGWRKWLQNHLTYVIVFRSKAWVMGTHEIIEWNLMFYWNSSWRTCVPKKYWMIKLHCASVMRKWAITSHSDMCVFEKDDIHQFTYKSNYWPAFKCQTLREVPGKQRQYQDRQEGSNLERAKDGNKDSQSNTIASLVLHWVL